MEHKSSSYICSRQVHHLRSLRWSPPMEFLVDRIWQRNGAAIRQAVASIYGASARCYRFLETNSCRDALGYKSLSHGYRGRNVTCRFVVESVYSSGWSVLPWNLFSSIGERGEGRHRERDRKELIPRSWYLYFVQLLERLTPLWFCFCCFVRGMNYLSEGNEDFLM